MMKINTAKTLNYHKEGTEKFCWSFKLLIKGEKVNNTQPSGVYKI